MAITNSRNFTESQPHTHPWIGWTTTDSRESAQQLARDAVKTTLAACAQVEGPLTSYYRWQGQLESTQEYRITFKFAANQRQALQQWITQHHPYQNPQWLAVEASDATVAYAQWVATGE